GRLFFFFPPLLTLPSFFKKAVAKQPSLASIAKERCKGGGKKLCLRRQGESPWQKVRAALPIKKTGGIFSLFLFPFGYFSFLFLFPFGFFSSLMLGPFAGEDQGPPGAGEDQGGLLRSLASLSTRCLRSWGPGGFAGEVQGSEA